MYETKITDKRWWIYDILGNAGWLIYIICLVIWLKKGITLISLAAVIPTLFIVIGITELVNERVNRLDRVLSRARLFRGFGALTLAGIAAVPVSIAGVMTAKASVLMLSGSIMLAVFAGLIFHSFKRI